MSGNVVSGLFDVTSLRRPTAGGHVIRGRAGSLPGRPGSRLRFQLAAKMAAESAETTEKKEACSPVVSAWTASIGEFKAFWRPATVVRCFHPLFDVQFHTGEIGKRHMNQLRTRTYISPSAKAASLRKRQSTAHSSSGNVRPTGSDSDCVVYLKSSVYLTSSVASSCIFNLLSDFGVGECGVRSVVSGECGEITNSRTTRLPLFSSTTLEQVQWIAWNFLHCQKHAFLFFIIWTSRKSFIRLGHATD